MLRAYIYSYISWLTSVTIVPSTPARLDSNMRRTSSKEPLLIACCRSAGPLNTREMTFQLHSYQVMYNEAWKRSAGPLNTRITFTHYELPYFLDYFPQVQYKGGNIVQGALQLHVCNQNAHDWRLFMAQILCTYSTVREYRPARQAIWVIQVILVPSNECGCVTVWELFEGRVTAQPSARVRG